MKVNTVLPYSVGNDLSSNNSVKHRSRQAQTPRLSELSIHLFRERSTPNTLNERIEVLRTKQR